MIPAARGCRRIEQALRLFALPVLLLQLGNPVQVLRSSQVTKRSCLLYAFFYPHGSHNPK
jgi:hypothetical protein